MSRVFPALLLLASFSAAEPCVQSPQAPRGPTTRSRLPPAPLTPEEREGLRGLVNQLACTPQVIDAMKEMWAKTAADGKEYGVRFDLDDQLRIKIVPLPALCDSNKIHMTIHFNRQKVMAPGATLALAHTHPDTGSGDDKYPSDADRRIPVPTFTVSRQDLYVTDPRRYRAPSRTDSARCRGDCYRVRGRWQEACGGNVPPVELSPETGS